MEINQDKLTFYRDNHLKYVLSLENSKDLHSIGKYLTEHLKVAGGYWSLTSIATLNHDLN
jgi:geranylgeranyl transferase type-2 subunit beta